MKKILLTVLGFSTLLFAGCGQQTTETSSAIKIVKIGVLAPLSGPAATIWADAVSTFMYARDEFNKNNNSIKIELVVEDGKCEWKDATSAAQKLVNIDQVKVILWGVCSSETIAAAKVTAPAWVTLVSAGSSSPEISKAWDYVYRYYSDINQAATMKEYLVRNWITKIALLYENNNYGVGLAEALTQALWKESIIVSTNFNSEEKDFSVIAKGIADKKKDIQGIVYIPSSDSSSINIIKSFDKEGLIQEFKGRILTSEVGYSVSVVKELWGLIEGLLSTQLPDPASLGQPTQVFMNEFKKQHEVKFADMFVVLYKESFDMVAAGILNKDYGIDKINDYIKTITKVSPRNGLFGSYYFNWVDAERLAFVVKQVKDGKLVTIQ
jgi:ABC-type branched-subunit amino acid transport system substrate-binding protein